MEKINGFSYQELFNLAIERPSMAQFEVTRNCNQRCFFCFRGCSPDKIYQDKPLVDWQKAIDKLVGYGVKELNFSGGEIFLYNDIDELIEYARHKGALKIVINTNGLVDLSKHNLSLIDELVFSAHGIEKVHDEIVGRQDAHENLIVNLEEAIEQGQCQVGINTTVVQQNVDSLEKIFKYFSKFNLLFHSFNLLIDHKKLYQDLDDYFKMFSKYLNFLKAVPQSKLKLRHGMHNIIIHDKDFWQADIPLPHCAAGKYKVVIDHQGDIYPCRYFQTNDFRCGNIFKDDFDQVWPNGKGFKFFRQLIVSNKVLVECQDCLKRFKCCGGCLAWRVYNKKLDQYDRDVRCGFSNAHIRG